MTKSLIFLYQVFLSPLLVRLFGPACRFKPTCSQYAKEAIGKYGFFKGLSLSVQRVVKCHPFSKGGFDPVS